MDTQYRKAVLSREVALRVRDLLRQIAAEHELEIASGKAHAITFTCRILPPESGCESNRAVAKRDQLAGTAAGISALAQKVLGKTPIALEDYLAVSSGTITDEMVREYIEEQESEAIADDSRFPIDNTLTPRLQAEGSLVRPPSSISWLVFQKIQNPTNVEH